MLTSAKTLTSSITSGAAFSAAASRSSRRSSFSMLQDNKTSSAACYGVIALVVLAGIAINVVLIARSVSSIINAAH